MGKQTSILHGLYTWYQKSEYGFNLLEMAPIIFFRSMLFQISAIEIDITLILEYSEDEIRYR